MTTYPWPPAAPADLDLSTIARRCGVHRTTIAGWRSAGLTEADADLLATRGLGMHPASLWSDLWLADVPCSPDGELLGVETLDLWEAA